ncbi:hypothetical protein J1N35_033994 [Gossypium stocksii]|uniref:Uncharacterized protein n=1 Tax=Gossypium stocksii TaxID=47602 RepID=A0A9D3ZPM9_9ROSI|nr:hypothetical protein J1N35_033994 [Gossypium stocksii]
MKRHENSYKFHINNFKVLFFFMMATTTHESGKLRELASNFVKFDRLLMLWILQNQKRMKMNFLLQPRERQKLDSADYMCIGRMLNGSSNCLFNTYQNEVTTKEL